MNCEMFNLKELEVEQYQIREVLRCILHTIMFNRAFGLVRPRDIDSELFEITYVQCGEPDVEKRIEEKIDQFVAWAEKHPNKKSQVCLSFYETKDTKIPWFGNKVERLDWEKWSVQLNVVQYSQSHKKPYSESVVEDRSKRHAVLENVLREVTMQILRYIDEKHDHIPPILNTEAIPFPYEITIPSSSDSSFGMDLIKRILQTGPPTSLSSTSQNNF